MFTDTQGNILNYFDENSKSFFEDLKKINPKKILNFSREDVLTIKFF